MNILVKETDTYKIEHDLETNSILHTVKRFLVTDEWKDLLNTGHQYFIVNDLSKWISNNRDLPIIHGNLDNWLFNQWVPNMVNKGWKKWALVEPVIKQGKQNQAKYQERFASAGVQVQSFQELDHARAWMKN